MLCSSCILATSRTAKMAGRSQVLRLGGAGPKRARHLSAVHTSWGAVGGNGDEARIGGEIVEPAPSPLAPLSPPPPSSWPARAGDAVWGESGRPEGEASPVLCRGGDVPRDVLARRPLLSSALRGVACGVRSSGGAVASTRRGDGGSSLGEAAVAAASGGMAVKRRGEEPRLWPTAPGIRARPFALGSVAR